MGVESFQIVALTAAPGSDVRAWLMSQRLLPSVHADTCPDTFIATDSRHVVEAEVRADGVKTRVSIRFALCHPATVDDLLLEFVRRLAEFTHGRIVVAERVPGGFPDKFKYDELGSAFACVLRGAISEKRGLWRQNFGEEEAAVTTAEALRRFLLKQTP